jgi:hypothetical protein
MRKCYLEPEQQAAVALFSRNIQGPVVMLNLLRFRGNCRLQRRSGTGPARTCFGPAGISKIY